MGVQSSPSMVPYFTAKEDGTITWDDMDWCVEASGRESGDAVYVNKCNGRATQKWNWIPDGHGHNMIQLKDSDQCIVVIGESRGSLVELRRCAQQIAAMWNFGEISPLPTHALAQTWLSDMWHEMIAFIAIAGVGLLSFGGRFWRAPG